MAVISIALGWLVAGRVLGPLRAMTAEIGRVLEQRLTVQCPANRLIAQCLIGRGRIVSPPGPLAEPVMMDRSLQVAPSSRR